MWVYSLSRTPTRRCTEVQQLAAYVCGLGGDTGVSGQCAHARALSAMAMGACIARGYSRAE